MVILYPKVLCSGTFDIINSFFVWKSTSRRREWRCVFFLRFLFLHEKVITSQKWWKNRAKILWETVYGPRKESFQKKAQRYSLRLDVLFQTKKIWTCFMSQNRELGCTSENNNWEKRKILFWAENSSRRLYFWSIFWQFWKE